MNRAASRSSLRNSAVLLLVAAITLVVTRPNLHAQIGTSGTFSGTVQDASGAVVPGATVTATHLSTGAAHSATSDAQGRYQVSLLPLGEYRLEASHPGFRSKINTGLVLTVGKNQEVNFTLEVGQVSESVTVEGGVALVETKNSSVSSLVGSKEVSDLPLNGRSFDQLITLSAGAALYSQRFVNAYRGFNSQYSVGGSRPVDTKLMVDGSEYQGASGSSTNVATASGKMLGVDGIQEFAVVSNNGDASFGKKMGGQVNIVTKSGTNDFHGSLFEFIRNNVFDARNFFDRSVPPLKRNNYGFAVGGPLVKNHTFFFTNYERLDERRGLTSTFVVPDINARNGILPGGTVFAVSPSTRPILNFFPLPNPGGRNFGDGTAEASVPVALDIPDTFAIARVDHRFSDSDSLFGRYLVQSGERTDGTNGVSKFTDVSPLRVQLATLGYTKIFSPLLLNQATFGFNRSTSFIDSDPLPGVTIPPEMILIPGLTKTGTISFGTATQGNTIPTLGGGTAGVQERAIARNLFEFADQLNYTRGAHSLQIGGGMQRIQSNEFQGTQKRGFLQFASLQGLIIAQAQQIRGPLPGSDGFKSWRETFTELYVQDSYRLTHTFTLNLGLRWEMMSNPSETHGRIAVWVPAGNQLNGVYPNQPSTSDHLFTENHSGNFAPRIGFAWDVFGNGRTALRAGFGMFYSQIESDFRGQQSAGPPFWKQARVNNPPFPNPGLALVTIGLLGPLSTAQAPDVPTQLQYNLRIEQTVAPETVLAVAYVGSHSYHLVRSSNPQIPVPFLNAQSRLQITQTVVNPALDGAAVFQVWDSNAFYNSLQMEVNKKFSHGLRFKTAFTWSKTIDDAVTPILQPSGISAMSTVAVNHRYDRSRAPYDAGRQLVANWDYELPLGKHTGPKRVLLNGWQIGGILAASDGFPYTAWVGFSRSFPSVSRSDRADLAPGRSNNPILGGPDKYFDPTAFQLQPVGILGNVGEGTMTGPGLFTVDASLSKNFKFTERWGLLFRAEFFNLFNHPNFSVPLNNIFLANGSITGSTGRIQSTAVNSREIQFGLKLTF